MSLCDHKNVIKYYVSFLVDATVWLVMPIFEGGSLKDILSLPQYRSGIKDENEIAYIMREVLDGLIYFHENSQIHRDIKCSNIFVDKSGQIKIGDFGVSASLVGGKKRGTFVGSPCWMAPEVISRIGHDYKADIWSLGITAIELAQGFAPYHDQTAMKIIISILNNPPPTLPHGFSDSFNHFVKKCLQKDNRVR